MILLTVLRMTPDSFHTHLETAMTDPFDTHDESNTPDDDGWDGEYPTPEEQEAQAWEDYMEYLDAQDDATIPF